MGGCAPLAQHSPVEPWRTRVHIQGAYERPAEKRKLKSSDVQDSGTESISLVGIHRGARGSNLPAESVRNGNETGQHPELTAEGLSQDWTQKRTRESRSASSEQSSRREICRGDSSASPLQKIRRTPRINAKDMLYTDGDSAGRGWGPVQTAKRQN